MTDWDEVERGLNARPNISAKTAFQWATVGGLACAAVALAVPVVVGMAVGVSPKETIPFGLRLAGFLGPAGAALVGLSTKFCP